MHQQKLAHLDLKPGNVFLSSVEATSIADQSSVCITRSNLHFDSRDTMQILMSAQRGVPEDSGMNFSLGSSMRIDVHDDDADNVFAEPTTPKFSVMPGPMVFDTPDIRPALVSGGSDVCFKIGDLGHATLTDVPSIDLDDGDTRYLPLEIMNQV